MQAQKLWEALQADGVKLNYVIEILLPREVAKNRIMGRRLCKNDNNHPNNIFIDAIKPSGEKCRVCGGELSSRADDQDEAAIDKRHDIYYDTKTGTLAASYYFKNLADTAGFKYIELDGEGSIDDIKNTLMAFYYFFMDRFFVVRQIDRITFAFFHLARSVKSGNFYGLV